MTSPFTYDVTSGLWTLGDDLAALHGLTADQVVTTEVLMGRVHVDDRDTMIQRFERHLRQPGAYSCAYRMADAHGRCRHLRFVGNSVAAGGRVFRLEGFVLDIAEDISRWQNDAVAASAAHRATIEQAKGALMLAFGVDPDDAFRMLVGYSQYHNMKLREVAAFITSAVHDPACFHSANPVENLLDAVRLLGAEPGLAR